MICKYCLNKMRDLTHGYGDLRNYICKCGSHYYNNKWFNLDEWFTYVNDFSEKKE